MNLNDMRPGNRQAFDLILERLRARESATSIVKPTRYGKRDLIITSCWEAVQRNLISAGIVFSPASQATRQFYNERKLGQTIVRYAMPIREVSGGIRQLTSFQEYQPFSNGEFLLAGNIQLCLRTNLDDAIELLDTERYRTQKPIAIYIDECQFVADKKRWGEFFRRVQNAGALLIFLTATPYREDADAIPGFRYTLIDEKNERRYFTYDEGDGVHKRIDVWDGVRVLNRLEADDATTFREAWAELPPVLCKLDREVVSLDVDDVPLKQLSAAETRKALGRIVRDERFLDPAVRLVLKKLQLVQLIDPRGKAMIVTGSDQRNDRLDNAHAQLIKRLVDDLAPTILGRRCKVRIITLKSQDLDDDSLAKAMENFLEGDEDLVIVKQAGTVGLDDWRLKVLGYFTPVRSVAAMIQAWMRPATPEGGLSIAHLVMPEDIFCTSVWGKLVVNEGGDAELAKMSGWTATNQIESYLKEKEDERPEAPAPFGPGAVSGFDDSHGHIGSLEFYDEATQLFVHLPRIAEVYTKAEIAVALAQSGHAPTGGPQPPSWGLDRQFESLYRQIYETAKDRATHAVMQAGPYDQARFEAAMRQIFIHAYRLIGVPPHVRLREIKSADTLLHIKTIIEQDDGAKD